MTYGGTAYPHNVGSHNQKKGRHKVKKNDPFDIEKGAYEAAAMGAQKAQSGIDAAKKIKPITAAGHAMKAGAGKVSGGWNTLSGKEKAIGATAVGTGAGFGLGRKSSKSQPSTSLVKNADPFELNKAMPVPAGKLRSLKMIQGMKVSGTGSGATVKNSLKIAQAAKKAM